MIEPGTPAPDFTLRDQDGRKVSLAELRGQTVVLVFYPLDFSPVCTDQLRVYEEILPELRERNVAIYGLSVDSAFCHKAFRDQLGITIPLLADFNPKGEVARAFGAYIEERGHSARALVVIDPEGNVRWAYESPSPLEIPSATLILGALGDRQTA